MQRNLHKLAVLLPAAETPPCEFRLFVQGWNETENGRFLFDEAAAAAVMAAAEAHGVDRMIDLEHLSLDPEARHYDPDARGWAKLELRADGSLWAVDVRWTDDGAARLLSKRQRYVSPAFMTTEDGRITKVINIAITALPATHQTPALIAANLVRLGMMDPAKVKAILAALKEGDAESAMAICEALLVDAASGEAPAAEGPLGEPEAAAAPPEPPPADAPPEEEKKAEAAVAASLLKMSGAPTVELALERAAEWRKSHIALEQQATKLASERAALDASERRKLVGELLRLGAETPATAWAKDSDGAPDGKTPCKRLASEPIAELRDRVKALSTRKPANGAAVKPATAGGRSFQVGNQVIELSAAELAGCAAVGAKPEVYAANKAYFTRAR